MHFPYLDKSSALYTGNNLISGTARRLLSPYQPFQSAGLAFNMLIKGSTPLPAVSKVFEYLTEYFDRLNFFIECQLGSVKKSSCLGATLQLVTLIKANYRRKYVASIFIDLS